MVSNVGDIKSEVLVRLGTSSTSGYYSDTILNDWLKQAHVFCAGYRKWPFAEGRVSTTFTSSNTDELGNVVYNYPEGWKADSIRLLQIDGKRLEKLTLRDFQQLREDYPSANDRVYTDFAQRYYINPSIDLSGTITLWGQYTPAELDTSDNTTQTVFSTSDDEGNLAIVEEMQAYAYSRERDEQRAQIHHQKALELLEQVWKKYADEQFGYLTKNRGIWERIDVLDGQRYGDQLRRDQFY